MTEPRSPIIELMAAEAEIVALEDRVRNQANIIRRQDAEISKLKALNSENKSELLKEIDRLKDQVSHLNECLAGRNRKKKKDAKTKKDSQLECVRAWFPAMREPKTERAEPKPKRVESNSRRANEDERLKSLGIPKSSFPLSDRMTSHLG